MDEYLYLLGKLAPMCATCTHWRPVHPTDYRGACAIGAVYGAPAHDDRCDQHSALAKPAVDQQSMARGDMASAWGGKNLKRIDTRIWGVTAPICQSFRMQIVTRSCRINP